MFELLVVHEIKNNICWQPVHVEWPKVIWYLLQKFIIFLDLKAAALAVMIFSGQPNLDKMLVSRNPMIIGLSNRDGFYPFGEIVSGSKDPFMLAKRGSMYFSNEV